MAAAATLTAALLIAGLAIAGPLHVDAGRATRDGHAGTAAASANGATAIVVRRRPHPVQPKAGQTRHGAHGAPGTATTVTATDAGTQAALAPTVLTPPAQRPSTPAEARLGRTLDRLSGQAGPGVGVLVYDLSARTELYDRNPATPRPPASVEKLWTTTAVLDLLGPDATLDTTVLGAGHLAHGVWHGNLYLHGGGDPTFGDSHFNQVWNGGYGPTPEQLIAQLRRHGIRAVSGRVFGDESIFDQRRGGLITGYKADSGDFGGQLSALEFDHGTIMPHYNPATFAAHQFVQTMRVNGMTATAGRHDGVAPRHARLLAKVSSPPMSVMLRLMDVPSDDLFAELFAKQLGLRYGTGGGTIASGARVIAQTIRDRYGLRPKILDGSGLSRDDRTSPEQIVQLLTQLWRTPVGNQLQAALPTVGVNGTVEYIARKTPAARRCIAKTGTLNDVTNLAGYCAARGGHELAFGLFVDGPDNGAAFALESRMIAAIAAY